MTGSESIHSQVEPEGWATPKGYSNGMLAAPGCRLLTIAGQVGWDANEHIVSPVLHEQLGQALRNIRSVLEQVGGGPEHLVRITYYVKDCQEYRDQTGPIGKHYREIIGRHFPPSTLVQVADLLEKGARVEVEATAAIPEERLCRPEDR